MLGALLPGLRESRSDIVSGALIVAILWLLLADELGDVFGDGASPELQSLLSHRGGVVGWVLALGTAYLVGSAWVSLVNNQRLRVWYKQLDGRAKSSWMREGTLRPLSIRAVTRLRVALSEEVSKNKRLSSLSEEGFEWFFRTVLRESIMIGPTLNFEYRDAFNEYSRIRSEGELRDAVCLPLAVFGVVLAFESGAAFPTQMAIAIAAIVLGIVAFFQARQLTKGANSQLLHAVASGAVVTAALEMARNGTLSVEEIEANVHAPYHLDSLARGWTVSERASAAGDPLL